MGAPEPWYRGSLTRSLQHSYAHDWLDHSSFNQGVSMAVVTTSASWSVEVVYRGIFQKRLANRISRGVVLGARKEGKVGTAFARYGDSPERNGVPAKNFAVVATDEVELESSLARYEPTNT